METTVRLGSVAHVGSDDFSEKVLQSDIPVLVDFMADWCPPCRAIGPELEAVAAELSGKATIFKLNVDDHPDIETAYGVRTIPTLIIYKNGEVVDTLRGLLPRKEIARKLLQYV